jgi:c-di-AMP phosphodiesterase-like protein
LKFKKRITYEIVLGILMICFVILATFSALQNVYLSAVSILLFVATFILFFARSAKIRSNIAKVLFSEGTGTKQKSMLKSMNLPIVITETSGKVLWYNDHFKNVILDGEEIFLEEIKHTIDNFNAAFSSESGGSEYIINGKHYLAFSGVSGDDDSLFVTFLIDDDFRYRESEEYKKTRPSIILFLIDNLDEIESELKVSDSAVILSEVNRVLENFIGKTSGILIRASAKHYIAIVEEQHMESIIDDRFSVLDEIRNIETGSIPITLSIGVGREGRTFKENNLSAKQALDMALGRGGDQAALKTRNGYVFYGGVTREIERRNQVKARIIASALTDLFKESENIVVMGHKMSDLDSLGSALGIARAAAITGCDVNVLIDPNKTMAKTLYDRYRRECGEALFITPNEALDYVDEDTLVVVVDCHTPRQVEMSEVLKRTKNIAVIDHHRRMVGYIEDAVLFYHEPYASSCCEMVAELLQHIETPNNTPTKLEAEGMLAGIMLDTKNFTVRTGVRTFDAASYLKRLGADTIAAKSFFFISMDEYQHKSELVSMAVEYRGCAVVIDDQLPESMRVVVPQSADDLLTIEGVEASIVAVRRNNAYNISARSLGGYNVQIIMEQLGGGGHQTTAGAQVENVDEELLRKMIYNAIDGYLEKNEHRISR